MDKKTKIIIGVAVAAVALVLIVGAGIGFYSAMEADIEVGQTTEMSTETETVTQEAEPVTTTEPETTTETPTTTQPEMTTQEETTTIEQETGSVYEDGVPASTDNFIIQENIDTFFEGSVFIGDSVMMGFRNYVMGQPQGFLGGPDFLVSGSFSLRMALANIDENSIHPIYQGEQRFIWDSIALMKAKKAFLFFGLNDIDMAGVEGTCANYAEVVANIRKASPDTEIYIISMTNVLTGSEVGGLNNNNIRLLNEAVKEYCATADVQFIDIASFLVGEDGGLKPEYCSDAYVHQTAAAYDVWTKVLRWYASGGNYLIPEELETTGAEEQTTSEGETTGTDGLTETSTAEPQTASDEAAATEQGEAATSTAVTEQETTVATAEQETTPAPEIATVEETTAAAAAN